MANPRPVHFEVQADDIERAKAFYTEVFGWLFEYYGESTGSPYYSIVTGEEGEPGINGGLLPRPGGTPVNDAPVNAYVVTVACEDYDATAERIYAHGGEGVTPKAAIAGMAWQGYFRDPEGNIFGLHQPDPDAA